FHSADLINARIERLARVVPEVRARIEVGRVEVTAGELRSLELGDMLVLDRSSLHFGPAIEPRRVAGTIRVVFGDGGCAVTGDVNQMAPENAHPDDLQTGNSDRHTLAITVAAFFAAQHEEGVEIETAMDDTAQSAQRGAVLDGLLLTVVAQIA